MKYLVPLILFLTAGIGLSEEPVSIAIQPADTLVASSSRTDTIYVIPAGPVAGSFTTQSRLTVVDTIAGWAKIAVEGWVPVAAVADRISPHYTVPQSTALPPAQSLSTEPEASATPSQQCIATTLKGARCKRNAKKGSEYCWQHQSR